MLTFFQHFLIGKMEEETQNDEEAVDQEQPESEHSDETVNPDSPEPVEENTEEETPDNEQVESDSDVSPEAAETPDSEEAAHSEETPEAHEVQEIEATYEVEETPESQDTSETEGTPEVEVISETEDVPEPDADNISETENTPAEDAPSEVEVMSEDEEVSEENETSETEEAPPEVDETPAPSEPQIPYSLGESEELYDFVALFEESKSSGAEHISANMADSAGGVTKPALFEHPAPSDSARIVYELPLPSVEENETLFLHFSIGLRDGVIFDDEQRQPGGVKFSIEISGEQCFESVSTECQWTQNGVDLTRFAGQEVELVFITQCNVEGNSSYAWALWGQPKLLKLTRTEDVSTEDSTEDKKVASVEIQCGLAIAKLPEDRTVLFEFNRDGFTPAHEIASEIHNQSDVEPIDLILYAAQPKLEIISVGTTAAVVGAGEAFEVQCTIKNVGAGPLDKNSKTRLSINNVKLRRGRAAHNVKTLAPDETSTFVWYARSVSRPNVINFNVSLKSRYVEGTAKMEGIVHIRPALPKLETQVVPELHTYMDGEHVVLGNKNLRIVLVHSSEQPQSKNRKSNKSSQEKSESGFEYYAIFVAKGSAYQQVATSKMIAEVAYLSGDKVQHFNFIPNDVQLAGNSLGESIVRLTGEHKDSDGVTWSLQLQLILTEDTKRVKTVYRLTVDGERELLAFRGAEIYAGHKSAREKKTAALFPGLEFLEVDEPSSNTRDAAPPLNNRLVPHPYKITVPVMAIEMQKSVVGIAWNPLQSWNGEAQNASAVFASPNWYHQERNHLMGLFLPTVPEWVKENTLVAETAYQLTSERPITLDCEIIADGNASILDAISHWTTAYGTPEPLESPRNDEEEVLLSRHGFMHTVWDEEARQSRHCVDWASHNEPGFATLLWYDYLVTKSEDVKERVKEIAEKTIADSNASGLAARGSCHILSGEFPFYYGHLDAALGYYEAEVQPIIESQSEDGSWGFQPTSEKTENLGKLGDVVLGTCAAKALKLLKHARITGNKTSLEAGKKALSFMDRFSVPRGAQTWECPLYEPDILAAAHAIGAYVEAHEITGNKSYLKRAEYWAATGLPFLYHWHLPDRPGMRFASIPVFGTTFYTHSWLGVPVQWNGLVYAYYLQRLNQHTRDERWRQVAEGITISAMYQQWTDGELKGSYPDGFYGFCTEGKGPHLNPEDIMVNVYTLRGLDPGVKTAITGSIHLSSGATIEALTASRNGEIKWTLNYAENEISHTLITGYEQSPSCIRAQTAESDGDRDDSAFDIPQVDSLEDVTSGWRYIQEKDAILIKQIHTTAEMQFQLIKEVE
jgi:chemotaxis protein histidine kinase CheA